MRSDIRREARGMRAMGRRYRGVKQIAQGRASGKLRLQRDRRRGGGCAGKTVTAHMGFGLRHTVGQPGWTRGRAEW